MACTDPERLAAWCDAIPGESLEERRSELLWRYLGTGAEAPEGGEIRQHLSTCPDCADALEAERLLASSRKSGKIIFARCPSSEELLLYLERDPGLSPFRRLEIKGHLDHCRLCREETAWAGGHVAEKSAEPRWSWSGWVSWRWSWAAVAAAAAVLVLAMFYPTQFGARRYARYAQIPDLPYEAINAEFASLFPADAERFRNAAQFISLGEYGEGSQILNELETRHTGDPSIVFFQGYVAVRQGQWEKATLLCTKAEKRAMHGFRCWYLANVALKSGNLDVARNEIQHAKGHAQYADLAQRLEKIVN